MARIGESAGIGAVLVVNAETNAFAKFMGDLHKVGIEVADRDGMHVTIVDSSETKTLLRSERDTLAFDRARNSAGDYLASLALGDLCLYPALPTVQSLGHQRRRVGIKLADHDGILKEIRDGISDIFFEEARLRVGSGPGGKHYEAHISTGRRVGRNGSPAAQKTKRGLSGIRVPRAIHIKGFDIGERVFRRGIANSRTPGYDRSYLNSSPRNRR